MPGFLFELKVMDMQKALTANIQYLKGVGPAKANALGKLKIFNLLDLLEYYPRRYEDRSQMKKICELIDGELETIQATIMNISESRPRKGLSILKLAVTDGSGTAQVVWFNKPHYKKIYACGMELVISGKVKRQYQIEIHNPMIETLEKMENSLHVGRITPVYALNDIFSQRSFRSLMGQALESAGDIQEVIPENIRERHNLLSRRAAVEKIHFPSSLEEFKAARDSLAFEELFLLQCGLLQQKKVQKRNLTGIKHAPDGKVSAMIYEKLPFSLTSDQQKSLQDIKLDMEDGQPMQRLLQGDVGSGKTIVAALALAKTVENGYQGAMMAPTEILAEQHYCTLHKLFEPAAFLCRP